MRMNIKNVLVEIPVEKINRPQEIDRIDISDEAINELAENIKATRLLQNPLIREVNGKYEIIAGDRRILAIKKLGWTSVQVVLCVMTDVEAAEARASENLKRIDLTVIEEGRIYRNLKTKYERTVEQIAEKFGISPGTVVRRMDLLKLPQCLQDAMHRKQISYGVGEALAGIADKTALEYYLGFACDHGVTVVIARQWCSDWKSSMRRRDEEKDPAEVLGNPMVTQPTYLACDICQEAEMVQNLTHLKVCKECIKRMSGSGQ